MDMFVGNNGKMRLITSPDNLSEYDLNAIENGISAKTVATSRIEQVIENELTSEIVNNRLQLLTWMIANGRLDVKIALRRKGNRYYIFHEKIGVFGDADGNWTTFTGSPNETKSGLLNNSESFTLHKSWTGQPLLQYAIEERQRFEDVWNERVDDLVLWNISEWLYEPLREKFGVRPPDSNKRIISVNSGLTGNIPSIKKRPFVPPTIKIRDYQKNAINQWFKNKCTGVFAMATGTGKTITSLCAVTQLSKITSIQNRPLLILVIVPLVDLVYQWKAGAELFNFSTSIFNGKLKSNEIASLKSKLSALPNSNNIEFVISTIDSITTNKENVLTRFLSNPLDSLIAIIGDEMHSLGTKDRLKALPSNSVFRLGLSATPKRHGDEIGTEGLLSYFGNVIIKIDIYDAIYKYHALVPYYYNPIFVELTESEKSDYLSITRQIALAYTKNDEEKVKRLILIRNRIKQHAFNKISELDKLYKTKLSKEKYILLYASEGKDKETDIKQIERYQKVVTSYGGHIAEQYIGEHSIYEREIKIKNFTEGHTQTLLSMKCLDEGVDIPSARIGVITASTQNPRQFVQRRGRLLRTDKSTYKTEAIIYDFLVTPPRDDSCLTDSEKKLVGSELSRSIEMAESSINKETVYDIIDVAMSYQLEKTEYTWLSGKLECLYREP